MNDYPVDPILGSVRPLKRALFILCMVTISGCGIDEFLDEPPGDPTPDDIANAALAPKAARTYEAIGQGVICPGSFGTFKRKIADSSKDPGSAYQWHHIVNQNPSNVDRFGNRLQLHRQPDLLANERTPQALGPLRRETELVQRQTRARCDQSA